MREFVIMTDSDSDIPYAYAEENNVEVFLMPYTVNGVEKFFDLGKETDFDAFYNKLADGAQASTSTRSPQEIREFFEDILIQDKDILYLCFSSKLSSHYDLSLMAKKEALEKYPDARIEIIDTKSIAMGLGLLVMWAVKMKNEGRSFDEIWEWQEEHKLNARHFFTVDDLKYLKRTGRLSAVQATLGSILDLKPVLTLVKDGSIVAYEKIKGKKKVVSYLAQEVKNNITDDDFCLEFCAVLHGNNREMGEKLMDEVKAFGFKDVKMLDVGPVIGCHAGPGVLAVVMLGKQRPV